MQNGLHRIRLATLFAPLLHAMVLRGEVPPNALCDQSIEIPTAGARLCTLDELLTSVGPSTPSALGRATSDPQGFQSPQPGATLYSVLWTFGKGSKHLDP